MGATGMLAKLAVEVAEDQWGLVTRAQAMALGVPRATFARLATGGALVRVAHGVYRIVGSADPGHLALRAAWLQLDSDVPAWERVRHAACAVVSHRSAAEVYGLGDLIADVHEFSVPVRRQTRRDDVRLYLRPVPAQDRAVVDGLPVTRPHRIVADLLAIHEDGSAIATIAADALGRGLVREETLIGAVAPFAPRYRVSDGEALMDKLLERAA